MLEGELTLGVEGEEHTVARGGLVRVGPVGPASADQPRHDDARAGRPRRVGRARRPRRPRVGVLGRGRRRPRAAGRPAAGGPAGSCRTPDCGRHRVAGAEALGRGGRWQRARRAGHCRRARLARRQEEADVARGGRARGVGRAAALGVEEREVAGDAGERALVVGPAGVVDHPGLQRDAAARGLHEAQRAPLLRPVDDRRGGDQPVAAGRACGAARSRCGGCGRRGRRRRAGRRRGGRRSRRRRRSGPAAGGRRPRCSGRPRRPARAAARRASRR